MAQVFLGKLLAERRKSRRLSQEDVASVLGMTRGNYSQIETGKRKEVVIDPDRATKLCRLLEIEMLDLVLAMGYPIKLPGMPDSRDAAVLKALHELSPGAQDFLRRGLGLES